MDRIAVEHKIREMVLGDFEKDIEDALRGCEIFTDEVLTPEMGDEPRTALAQLRASVSKHKAQGRKNVEGTLKVLFATASDSELGAWLIFRTSQNLNMFNAALNMVNDTMNAAISLVVIEGGDKDPLASLGYTGEGELGI